MNEELDSQLSAMFDNELPDAECELLARRLSRDPDLKARWGRYAVIGAVIRAERGVTLDGTMAGRVSAALSSEPALTGAGGAQASDRGLRSRWWQPVAGAGLAAGVAVASILWVRSQALPGGQNVMAPAMIASTATLAAPAAQSALQNASLAAPDSFVVPPVQQRPMMVVPATELADYVVAHSAFSWPVSRGNLLSALMVSEPGTSSTPVRSDQPVPGVQGNAIQNPK
ncbi:MAG TPA: sigma-E factor negative regulatory protein [Steroidobacteraceae bacterium]|jgi:negative regulator of sigma E activity|nr:sigma-E factor negative regulatory protein [Steroidobacteraceae bacterium]